MMDAKADTTAIRTDSVLAWLQAINEPWADYDATGILYAKGETNTADNMLEGLSGKYNFDDAELLNHQTYISLWNLMKTVQNEVRNIYSLQPSEKETLLAIAQGDAGNNAKNIAQAILEVNGDLPHKMCAPIVGNPTVERRYKSMNIKDRADGLSVRPNPADAYVLFTYKFPLAKSALSIKVFDISGRQVTTMQLKGNNGQEVWDVRNIAPGTYSYTLYDGNMGISYGKVIVIKR